MDVRGFLAIVSLRWVLSLALLVLLAPSPAVAQTLPKLTAPVNDLAGVIDAASAAALDARIRALLVASGDTVVVATVESFAPYGSIEEYAVRMFEQSGIGNAERDRGVLVLLAVNERRVRVEVGYGLEEFITDGFSGDVIRQQMLPEFRSGNYGPGLVAGTTEIIRRIGERRNVSLDGLPPPRTEPESSGPSALQIILIVLVLIALSNLGSGGRGNLRGRRGGGWHGGVGGFGGGFGGFGGGGRGGGGFGGFGGGRSGGGGASGGW